MGTYTLFHERVSVFDGRYYVTENMSGLTVRLAAADGSVVAFDEPDATTSYEFAGRSGTSIFTFEIAAPGSYRLIAGYGDGRQEPKAVLAIGRGFVGKLFGVILGTMAIGFGSAGIAIAITATTFLKRRSARRAAAASSR